MTSLKPITAKELLNSLAVDASYQEQTKRRYADLAALEAEFAEEEQVIAREAGLLGYEIRSVWDFVNNVSHSVLACSFVGPYDRAYPMLIRHLQIPHHPRVREGVVRALTVRDGGEPVWRALLDEFNKETVPGMRWTLANALKVAMPYRLRAKHPEIALAFKSGGAL